MKDFTRKRLEAIIAMVEGPIEDSDAINLEPEQHINDLRQIWTMCKNALHEDPVDPDVEDAPEEQEIEEEPLEEIEDREVAEDTDGWYRGD